VVRGKILRFFSKEVNQAVKNNPEKFPSGYIVETDRTELVKNFDRFKNLKHSTAQPKAFTEKGLYMLATIIKSPQATAATISIIEVFTKLRELSHTIVTQQYLTYKFSLL